MNNNDEQLGLINMDETPVFFEMSQSVPIELKDNNNVTISTFGKDKKQVSVTLSIARNGEKLSPMMIFKG